jgi:DNA-binding response OmpR family regulator
MNPTQQHDTSRYRLLLVDDSPEEVRLLIERLRGAGYTLSVALDGERGYQRAISLRPDLILLDVHMPRIDGFALCRRLQATPATASIPIIFLSAAADIESRLSGLQNGARDYVIKPYSAEEVLAKIRLHLSLSPTTQTGDPEAAVSSIDADRTLVDAAKRYIDNHLRIDFSLADIANALATHKKRLSLAFHLHENKTVFQYVREARIQTPILPRRSTGIRAQHRLCIGSECATSAPQAALMARPRTTNPLAPAGCQSNTCMRRVAPQTHPATSLYIGLSMKRFLPQIKSGMQCHQ